MEEGFILAPDLKAQSGTKGKVMLLGRKGVAAGARVYLLTSGGSAEKEDCQHFRGILFVFIQSGTPVRGWMMAPTIKDRSFPSGNGLWKCPFLTHPKCVSLMPNKPS